MQSCIYEGNVSHRRQRPVDHHFAYRLFMVYVDLAELPMLVGASRTISNSKFAPCSFLRSDHLYSQTVRLEDEVRQAVRDHTGELLHGPIRLLTQLRHFGYYFSPLNLFFLFDPLDESVQAILAEVNNTPWGERHCYVLWDGNRCRNSTALEYTHAKAFHVSPFMSMNQHYRWQIDAPGTELRVRLTSYEREEPSFRAEMSLTRRELGKSQLRRMVLHYPLITARISAAIYYQAFRLWCKKCPFFPHPKNGNQSNLPVIGKKEIAPRIEPTCVPPKRRTESNPICTE